MGTLGQAADLALVATKAYAARFLRETKTAVDLMETHHDRVHRILQEEFRAAVQRRDQASAHFDEVRRAVPSGLPHPDGTQRIHNASRELSAARKEMMKAHNRLNDYLGLGIVPEDLKRSG